MDRTENYICINKSIGMCVRGSRSIFLRGKLEQSIKDDELLSELSSKF